MAQVAVVGATGYTGAELVSLFHQHPGFELAHLTSETFQGQPFSSVYPRYQGRVDLRCEALDPARLPDYDLVVFALPHGMSMEYVPGVRGTSTRILDMGADYRFGCAAEYETVYGEEHTDPEGFEGVAYGLPEMFADEVQSADLVANPGCYATACLIPLMVLDGAGLLNSPLVIDAKSGISGAGRSPSETNTFVRCNEDIRPYKVAEHRHEPEILQHLDGDHQMTFVPHVVPLDRGIEAALYIQAPSPDRAHAAQTRLREVCEDQPFFRYQPEPSGVKAVAETPYWDVHAVVDDQRVIVFSWLDNLGKGAATQAVQNANLMFDYTMERGLLSNA